MENATKALYIAAGVLMGVMILSLAVMLFSSMQAYIQGYKEDIEYNALNTFNNKYQKYVDNDTDFTIQDVVTVAGIYSCVFNHYEKWYREILYISFCMFGTMAVFFQLCYRRGNLYNQI